MTTGRRVLVVEDDLVVAMGIARSLRRLGYEPVGPVANGLDAVRVALADSPHAILMDVRLGDGIDGVETAERIHADRRIPVVYLTAYSDEETIRRATSGGAYGYVMKPFDERELRAALEIALHKHEAEEARRAADEALLRINSELDTFSTTVAHDLRGPLRRLRTMLEDVVDPAASPTARARAEALMRTSLDALDQLVSRLLDLARAAAQPIERTSVDLAAIAREVLAELDATHPERIVELRAPPSLIVHAEPTLARTLMTNLIHNAWKFTATRERGTITIDKDGDAVFVRDDGIGFSPEKADDVFRPFRRLHSSQAYEGSGIGLATVRRVVERHGGKVWAEGRPGKGATIWFTLP